MSKNYFSRIFSYAWVYKKYFILNILSNIFYAFFGTMSMISLFPMLKVLFEQTEALTTPPDWRGGLDIVKRSIMVIMEMSHIEYNQGAPSFIEADKFMEEIGFKRGIQIGYSTNNKGEVFQEDFVYINKKYIK